MNGLISTWIGLYTGFGYYRLRSDLERIMANLILIATSIFTVLFLAVIHLI